MCGRYSVKQDLKKVEDQLKLRLSEKAKNWKPSYNIAPSQLAPVVTSDKPDVIDVFHFGLVPHWAKDKKVGYKMINARSETLLEKPSFKPLLVNNKRCLVLADSFFEWKKQGKEKQPFRIYLPEREVFFFAGLWSSWKDPEGEMYNSYSIITTAPNKLMAKIHDRMPVILTREEEKMWLEPDQNPKDLLKLLNAYPADAMKAYEISSKVNKPTNNYPEILDPV
ncbi:SOS response-associated peptidase [Cyclobacterium sp. 1_MG-2023]|uniref:SOS response-associated peptidase n=1 Tax=Cyclobacterium sp. 1_MG-2023 TaxID=3062681 RepID=UPI0026E438E4|nr:SOS response-associated peptidase [Cyclobacterium sp. 1_MG-2023]MDO6437063.1 SOS response-associated peptidase [Cyclobacterium sp. 1_MG-2023]